MPLYEIVKSDGTREKVSGSYAIVDLGTLTIGETKAPTSFHCEYRNLPIVMYAPGTWLEVWRREGLAE